MEPPFKKFKDETDNDQEDDRYYESGMDRKLGEIWDIVDAGEDIPKVDAPTFKKMIMKFDKALMKNQNARSKFADDPLKFADSELDLVEEIKNITSLSETPNLYKLLLPHVPSVLSLFQHENTDILIAATDLLNEWTDEELMTDASEDAREGMEVLVKSLVCLYLIDFSWKMGY
jgi:beta-catenin-like protein 1